MLNECLFMAFKGRIAFGFAPQEGLHGQEPTFVYEIKILPGCTVAATKPLFGCVDSRNRGSREWSLQEEDADTDTEAISGHS